MASPSIQEVLAQELAQVETSRRLRLDRNPQDHPTQRRLIGLALSGGGIRSATFNLGLLQALAKKKLLRAFDYVSTVSGGGYIGGWLMAWMHHQGIGIKDIEQRLSAPPNPPKETGDLPEVHFLRDYSNYLTPRRGFLRADFWAFAASYLRNTTLNQIILVLALLALLLVPRTIVYGLYSLELAEEALQGHLFEMLQPYMQSQYFALALGLLLGFAAVIFMGLNLVTVDAKRRKRDYWFAKPWAVHTFIAAPLFLASALFTYGCGQFLTEWGILDHPKYRAPLLGIFLYFGMWAGSCLVRRVVRGKMEASGDGRPGTWLVLSSAALTGAVIGYLFVPFGSILIPGNAAGVTYSKWHIMTFGTPASLGIMMIAGVLHIGLMGRGMSDAHREWWARLGGWLLIYSIFWLFFFLVAIYFPEWLGKVLDWEKNRTGHPVTVTGVLAWVVSTAYGVFFAKSGDTGKWTPGVPLRQKLLAHAARLTPYVFILGLLMALSVLAARVANSVTLWGTGLELPTLAIPSDVNFDWKVPTVCLAFLMAAVFVSWRVDINQFSVHYLYRNRLVRCYLGASVPGRNAQPFTGFSDADNLPLGSLKIPANSDHPRDARPIPILNTSLNVVRGKELAVQTRKARSFAFTPLYAGFTRQLIEAREWESFFGETQKLASKLPGFEDGVTLGTAVAISGAAASPNMGSYSEPALAFLMTLFDVRLGWWVGNPKGNHWEYGSPNVGFYCLLQELLGTTSDNSEFVYLSDGGHFENLGLYELVRRKCKLIVASDASWDSGYEFGDLHNAIERCRTDFGVEIRMSGLNEFVPDGDSEGHLDKRSKGHYAVGKICYNLDSPEEDGTIIYLKPALVEGDPDDVLAYAKKNQSFPHDTTADQWFDEAHFENYRALGMTTGAAASEQIAAAVERCLK